MEQSTISCFSSFICLENFFCINRSFLIGDRRQRIFGNVICTLTLSAIISAIVGDAITGQINIRDKTFQGVSAIEFMFLVLAARYRTVFVTVLKRLDEKCGADDKYLKEMKRKIQNETFISIVSVIIDIGGLSILGFKPADIYLNVIIFAAHEAETIFLSLIIDGINLRLVKLHEAIPSAGSRVYRHTLIASSKLNIEFTPRILVILGGILFRTVSYSCRISVMFSDKDIILAVYLLWREMKAMYCVGRLCGAAYNSETICQNIAFQLAQKLAFDPAFDKAKNPKAYAIVKRWYSTALDHRPYYVRGSVFDLGLSIPLYLVDTSINYVLIIIQIYVAYNLR